MQHTLLFLNLNRSTSIFIALILNISVHFADKNFVVNNVVRTSVVEGIITSKHVENPSCKTINLCNSSKTKRTTRLSPYFQDASSSLPPITEQFDFGL